MDGGGRIRLARPRVVRRNHQQLAARVEGQRLRRRRQPPAHRSRFVRSVSNLQDLTESHSQKNAQTLCDSCEETAAANVERCSAMNACPEPITLPRTDWEAFCKECNLPFDLLEESPLRTTCLQCFEKLGCPALDCQECGKPIPPGETCHLYHQRLCLPCAARERVFDPCYHVVAWRKSNEP